MDPKTGEVFSMSGGYRFGESEFNRAIQARRQPGSSFKPIVYSAALDVGFTLSSELIDSPRVMLLAHRLQEMQKYGLQKIMETR